uniref:lymphocyte antigen 6 complex locus protein G6f n=1 Tax=Jaculus jaculus TaxID=51337 RepID=UPI00064D3234|nr:lymphocyte antigen 6 complex locus protein G6f [Jaculus jaculus]
MFLLLLLLCGAPKAAADSIQAIYVVSGESVQLPCPLPSILKGEQLLSWFRSPAAGSSTILVAQVRVTRTVQDLGKTEKDSRFRVLGNYSLWLEGCQDRDAGRYWCTVLDEHRKYQNWRVYDVSVLKGSQFSVRSADGFCSLLLCSAVPPRHLGSVTWLEEKGHVKGHTQYFWGNGAALLLVCPLEGLPEPRSWRPRTIHCLMPQNKRLSFSLAVSMGAAPTVCAPFPSWDVPWILMLLLTVGQGLTILALGIMLWKRRAPGAQCQDASIPPFKPETQVYENIHLARLR